MKEIPKRTEGKVKSDYKLKDIWEFYKKEYPEGIKDYKVFTEVLKKSNLEILKVITEESKLFKLPYRLGVLGIKKFERSYKVPKNKRAVDWKRTKEEGTIIYHTQKWLYNWYWDKSECRVQNKTVYKFIACRKAKRLINKMLQTKEIDYFK